MKAIVKPLNPAVVQSLIASSAATNTFYQIAASVVVSGNCRKQAAKQLRRVDVWIEVRINPAATKETCSQALRIESLRRRIRLEVM